MILAAAQGYGGARDLGIWDVRTGIVTPAGEPQLGIADLTADGGTALVRAPRGREDCAMVATLADLTPADGRLLCGPASAVADNALLSPGGTYVAVGGVGSPPAGPSRSRSER